MAGDRAAGRLTRVGLWSGLLLSCAGAAWLAMSWRAGAPAAEPVLTVSVNGADAVDVTPGTPLIFELTLRGERRGRVSVGSSFRPWHEMMRLEDGDGRPLPWPVSQHGEPKAVAVSIDGGDPRISTVVDAVADLEWQRSTYTVTLAAAPDHTQSLSGTTRVLAVLDAPWWTWSGWSGRVTSRPVAVNVPPDAADRGELRLARLALSAEFFLGRQEFEKARAAGEELTRLIPDRAGAHVLHGDALAGLERRDEALTAYRRALDVGPRSYEEPALLLDRMARVSSRRR